MNCKPGDLAVVVDMPRLLKGNGKIVRLKNQPHLMREGYPCWEIDGECLIEIGDTPVPLLGEYKHGDFFRARFFMDKDLRPIRDPGDDAQDETLSWLPVPSREGVEA